MRSSSALSAEMFVTAPLAVSVKCSITVPSGPPRNWVMRE
jgi:hypothetical protein